MNINLFLYISVKLSYFFSCILNTLCFKHKYFVLFINMNNLLGSLTIFLKDNPNFYPKIHFLQK